MAYPRPLIVGDWVYSNSPGIWQIYRVLPIVNEMRFSLSDRRKKSKRVLIFSRRLVDASWNQSFKTECCEQTLVSTISAADNGSLVHLLQNDARLRESFENYAPESLDLMGNLTMRVPKIELLESFCSEKLLPPMRDGLAMDDILRIMEEAGMDLYANKLPINATLQVGCRDHEMRDGEFVFRTCRTIAGGIASRHKGLRRKTIPPAGFAGGCENF
jgi:hypothetical protein